MTTKKATKTTTPDTDEYTERVPLRPCRSWRQAATLARHALAFIVSDGNESGANRIKAAELILDRALGKSVSASVPGPQAPGFEEWLRKQSRESGL